MLDKMFLSSNLWMKSKSMIIQMRGAEKYFFLMQFVISALNENLRRILEIEDIEWHIPVDGASF